MNNVELARTLSWRENALFEEREKNVFDKPNEQRRACLGVFRGEKTHFLRSEIEPNSMISLCCNPIGRFCWELLMPVLLDKSRGVSALLLVKMDL